MYGWGELASLHLPRVDMHSQSVSGRLSSEQYVNLSVCLRQHGVMRGQMALTNPVHKATINEIQLL